MATLKTLKFYRTENGKIPFVKWFDKLNMEIRIRVRQRLDRLALGQKGDYRALPKGLYELKMHFGAGYRIYFSENKGNIILLITGGDKSSQSVDIRTSYKYLQDYRNNQDEAYDKKNKS